MKLLIKDRKGYLYTGMVVVFFAIILSFYFLNSIELNNSEQIRVNTMNSFISDLHRDLLRASYISGYRSLIALEEKVSDSGLYLTDAEGDFIEAFTNGSIDGVPYEVLINATFKDYLVSVNSQALKLGFLLNINLTNVSFTQVSPWDLAVDYKLHILLNDTRDVASWDYYKTFRTEIPIIDFKDPLYVVETFGKIPNTITKYTPDQYVNDVGDANDTTVLQTFLNNSYYVASNTAPSYIMRLEGNFSSSTYGIESLVNLEDLNAQGLNVYLSRSVIDYQYFNSVDADWCNIQNMPTYFKIADDHLTSYEIDPELDYSGC